MSFEKPSAQFRFSIFFLILLTVFSINGVLAQGTSSITGTVKDQNEAVVPGAVVISGSKGTGFETTTITDGNGKFEFKSLPAGQYLIRVKKGGFSENASSVSVEAGENLTQDFTISPGGLREEVTVTAAKGLRATSEIPQTVTTVGEEELEQRRPVSIGEAYEKSPSVLSTDTNPFRARPQIRGLQSNRILVTVDGERLNDPRFGADSVGVSPSLIDPSQIKQVEVVAGSGSSLYGSDAIGGSINIITKGPDRSLDGIRFDAKVTADYGSNAQYRKGTLAFGLGSKFAAVRVNFGRFVQPDYTIGKEGVTRAEVIKFGNFAAAAGAIGGQAMHSAYPIYDLAPGTKIGNSGARGYLGSIDFMVFPSDKQDFRIRYNVNPYRDLGVPFSEAPYATAQVNTGSSEYHKLSLRYERREIASWFPRLSASYYFQDYSRTLEDFRKNILNNSSYATPPGPPGTPSVFTGNVSAFSTKTVDTLTDQHNTANGFDVQFNFLPWKNAVLITGLNHSNNFSRDTFNETRFNANTGLVIPALTVRDGANTPRSRYKNYGWYNQLEYTPSKYLRISGGLRWDNWKTTAEQTQGYPNTVLGNVLLATLPLIQANPGSLSYAGAAGYQTLAAGNTIKTSSNVTTYNIGATVFIPGGINPFIRYSTSFREPDIINKFLFRNFTTATFFSLPSIPNTALKPERGKDIDVGVKISRSVFQGSLSYYRNKITDAANTVQGTYCLNPPLPVGVVPTGGPPFCPLATQHYVQLFQYVNANNVVIKGVEAQAEGSISLGSAGSITPFATFSTIKASQAGDVGRKNIVQALYNSSAPLELDGSVTDIPFYSLPNYQGAFAPRYSSAKGNWWAEYEYRFTSKVTRVDPNDISFAGLTTYAQFGSFKGLKKQSVRGGVTFGEQRKVNVTVGVDNLTNNTYFQLFQPAPAAGRSFVFGISIGGSTKVNW